LSCYNSRKSCGCRVSREATTNNVNDVSSASASEAVVSSNDSTGAIIAEPIAVVEAVVVLQPQMADTTSAELPLQSAQPPTPTELSCLNSGTIVTDPIQIICDRESEIEPTMYPCLDCWMEGLTPVKWCDDLRSKTCLDPTDTVLPIQVFRGLSSLQSSLMMLFPDNSKRLLSS